MQYYYSDVGRYFQKEFRVQRKFLRRVRSDSLWSYDDDSVTAFSIFMAMTNKMSNSEKQIYFEDWLKMFGQILERYFRGETLVYMNILQPALWELLKTVEEVFPEEFSKTDLFLKEFTKVLMEETEQQVCYCESGTWNVSRLLLVGEFKLDTKLLGETLIRYGFQYGYDQKYYEMCCYELFNKNLEVKGKPISGHFNESILDSGNLRMQLGIELLLTLFSNTKNNKGVLRCLWRATPYPFITGEELLNMLMPHYHYEDDGPSLQAVCDAYVEYNTIFKVPVKPQPRSLKVLSKIQTRKTLYKAKGINNESIDSLQIPRVLHNYLKLGED